MREIIIQPPTRKYLKKLNEKPLKERFKQAMFEIAESPEMGILKKGNLHGIYTYSFIYQKTEYRIAYTLGENVEFEEEFVVIILADKREGFYEKLANYVE